MSYTKLTYNGIELTNVNIVEYRIDNLSTPDNPSTSLVKHTLAGEALVYNQTGYGEDESSNQAFLYKMQSALNQPGKSLWAQIEMQGDKTTISMEKDELHGPYFSAKVNQITGTNALMVQFTAEWNEKPRLADGGPSSNNLISFYCNARFSIDAMGLTTIRKTGSLHVRSTNANANALLSGVAGLANDLVGTKDTAEWDNPYPGGDGSRNDVIVDFLSPAVGNYYADFFRRYISGNLYRGFRRMHQEYAIDESRTRLLFDIVDQEFVRGIPAPARVGDCSYTFERSIEDSNVIGMKHFIASVKGDRNVVPGALLTLCIRLSQNRIDYAEDTILKVRVSEENMLSENAITYEVIARADSSQSFSPGAGNGASSGATNDGKTPLQSAGTGTVAYDKMMLKNILSSIKTADGTFEFFPAQQPDAYGSALIVHVTPGVFRPANYPTGAEAQFSYPTTLQLGSENPVIYSFPKGTFDAAPGQETDAINVYLPKNHAAVPTGPNAADLLKNRTRAIATERKLNPPQKSTGHRSLSINSGIKVAHSTSPSAAGVPVQLHAPYADITETVEGEKKNQAPNVDPQTRKDSSEGTTSTKPFALLHTEKHMHSGRPDLHGNRNMTAKHKQTTRHFCPGDIPHGGTSPTNSAFSSVTTPSNGQNYQFIQYFEAEHDVPYDETQGTDQATLNGSTGALRYNFGSKPRLT
jgi:hypothetical protein